MTTTAEPLPEATADRLAGARPVGIWRDTIGNILRQRNAVVGLAILAVLALTAIFADQIAPYDFDQVFNNERGRRNDPCIHLLGCPESQPQHLFGTDANQQDVFSRVVYGARISLQVGFITVGFAIVLGALIGAVAGFAGGWTDNALMRIMDVLLAFPALLLAIAIATVLPGLAAQLPALRPLFGNQLYNAQIAIGIVAIPVYARVMRASVLAVREQDFVTAARALGESPRGILFRRIFPNALTALIVQGTLGIAGAILDVAALSFLGLGAQPPLAEWGSMIGAERNSVFNAPHLLLFPGLALSLTVLAFNLVGDGLRDALDPRLNR